MIASGLTRTPSRCYTGSMDQLHTAQQLIDEMRLDMQGDDMTALDLLDYMGTLGVSFVVSPEASVAYFEALTS